MTCPACESSKRRPNCGACDFRCPECCARLIRSARPLKRLQQGHIAALQRFHGAEWARIWPQVQRLLKGD